MNDKTNIDDLISILQEFVDGINTSSFKSSVRLLILLSLGISKKMRLKDAMILTGCGKGSISNHIEKLKEEGIIKTRDISVFTSPRILIEITPKGQEIYDNYIKMFKKIVDEADENK